MKGFLIATAFGLGLLGATLSTAGTASASGKNDRHAHGGYTASKQFQFFIYGQPQHHYREHQHHGRQQAHRHGHKKGHKVVTRRHQYPQYRTHAQVVRPCHQTTGIGTDGHGRRARFGGVMCYDTYGSPFIVHGSHYIIHYF
jgi:hypothetical protein